MTHPHATTHAPLSHSQPFRGMARAIRFTIGRFLLMPIGAVIALIWANTAAESYFQFAYRLSFFVNEIAMALFFALLAQEVYEATMPGGALHSWRKWTLPLVAAAGGIAGAVSVYLLFIQSQYEPGLSSAWPIACAIDAVLTFYLLKAIMPRSGGAALRAASGDRHRHRRPAHRRAPVCRHGDACRRSGARDRRTAGRRVHARVARCTRSGRISSSAARPCGWPSTGRDCTRPLRSCRSSRSCRTRRERSMSSWTRETMTPCTMRSTNGTWPCNRSCSCSHWSTPASFFAATTPPRGACSWLRWWAVRSACLSRSALALAAGLHLPRHIGWRELLVIAFATSSGFSIALFFATGLLATGPVLASAKIGVIGSASGGAPGARRGVGAEGWKIRREPPLKEGGRPWGSA